MTSLPVENVERLLPKVGVPDCATEAQVEAIECLFHSGVDLPLSDGQAPGLVSLRESVRAGVDGGRDFTEPMSLSWVRFPWDMRSVILRCVARSQRTATGGSGAVATTLHPALAAVEQR